jgi:hypothetical protein
MRWAIIGLGIGVGAIIAVIVAIVAVLVLIGSGLESKTVASNLAINQAATFDGLRVVVDRVETATVPATSSQCAWAHVTAKNVGDSAIDEPVLVEFQFRGKAIGSPSSEGCAARDRLGFGPFAQLFPGQTAEGWGLVEVPGTVNLSDVTLVFNLGVIGGKKATWVLGKTEGTVEP